MLLKGSTLAKNIKDTAKAKVESLEKKPVVAVIQVGDDESAKVYTKSMKKLTDYVGMKLLDYPLKEDIPKEELLDLIDALNKNDEITGIFLHMPLPSNFNKNEIISKIDPIKDIDCITPHNIGLLSIDSGVVFPCTPYSCVEILKYNNIEIAGKECVILGRSIIVGKPLATMLLKENATVTICHSKTKDLKEVTKRADILLCAIGKANFVTEDMVKDGAVVVDVGINVLEDGSLAGDVDNTVEKIASCMTPVPGGVGPVTVAIMVKNILSLYDLQNS
ncbi:MAG: bifunctional 5,10-methylenetetrahydrofolate dehydrogenase/5,10-methenyltetrahydrofolate cyclohydrolase [Defluviitaleaceae bacterium]|nr:bifunctional 5,10-methylenetetrahydrofolate dehydrogenase/5,10-methenyltetrahydrofolate cyclohydrolase [Defluviitaleaceae bacterium]